MFTEVKCLTPSSQACYCGWATFGRWVVEILTCMQVWKGLELKQLPGILGWHPEDSRFT